MKSKEWFFPGGYRCRVCREDWGGDTSCSKMESEESEEFEHGGFDERGALARRIAVVVMATVISTSHLAGVTTLLLRTSSRAAAHKSARGLDFFSVLHGLPP